jgi:hypothetical protein
MSEPAYPAAQAVADRAVAHFVRNHAAAERQGRTTTAPVPDVQAVQAIIDVAFWASLRREEGLSPTISLAYLPPSATEHPLTFERWLPFTAASLARLAPAVERPGIHLGIWSEPGGQLGVWGTTRRLPALCFVLEVIASGLLVIKHRGEAFGKFVNVAVLEGDQVKMVDSATARLPDCPRLVASLLGVDIPGMHPDHVNVLVQLAASMRAHHRGGALLMVPQDDAAWRESIVTPVLYAVSPPYAELAQLVSVEERERESDEWQQDFRRAVEAMAGLTAVDGATLVNDRYELVAFGAKIMRRHGHDQVERVLLSEPVEGTSSTVIDPYQLGGTRHLSAAQFVHDQRGATALVASQDGRFTIFKWSDCDDIVHAHRVEALLL